VIFNKRRALSESPPRLLIMRWKNMIISEFVTSALREPSESQRTLPLAGDEIDSSEAMRKIRVGLLAGPSAPIGVSQLIANVGYSDGRTI